MLSGRCASGAYRDCALVYTGPEAGRRREFPGTCLRATFSGLVLEQTVLADFLLGVISGRDLGK